MTKHNKYWLQNIRLSRAESLPAAGKKAGMAWLTLRSIEQRERDTSVSKICKAARYYDVPPDDMFLWMSEVHGAQK